MSCKSAAITDNFGEVTKVQTSPSKSALSKGFLKPLRREMQLFFLIFLQKNQKKQLHFPPPPSF
jgi:hypothetical protein